MFEEPVYITLIKDTMKKAGTKSSGHNGPYKQVCLGVKPSEILRNFDAILQESYWDIFILTKLKEGYPTEGSNAVRDGVLKGAAHVATSRLQYIDWDYPKHFRRVKPSSSLGLENRPLAYIDKYPALKTIPQVMTKLRRANLVKTTDAKLVTLSTSTIIGDPFSISAHVYVVLEEPLTVKDFVDRAALMVSSEQTYAGLQASGKPKISHPYLDTAHGAAKKVFEYVEEGTPTRLIEDGNALKPQWGKRKKTEPFDGEPIKLYSDDDVKWAQDCTARARAMREKVTGRAEHDYKDGEPFHPKEMLYVGGKPYCTVGQRIEEPMKYPATQFDSMSDKGEQGGHMHYAKSGKLFIDFAHGDNSFHTVGADFGDLIPLAGVGEQFAHIHEHVKPEHKLIAVRSDTGTGKTRNTLRIGVGFGKPYKQGFFAVPTHSILNDITKSYKDVKTLDSGKASGQNSTEEDVLGMGWTAATMHKLTHQASNGYSSPGGVVVIDEIQNLFTNPNPSAAHRYMFDLITGAETLEQTTIVTLSATFDYDILAPWNPHVVNFEHKMSKTFRYVRTAPWLQLIGAKRSFIAINDRAKASLMCDFMNQIGKKAIIIHGQNEKDEEGITYTNVPDNLEDEWDCIIVTSAMKEGFSLKKDYEVVYIDKYITNHSGAGDDEQFAARVRAIGAEYFIRIGDKTFIEPDTRRPNLAMYRAAGDVHTKADQYKFIDMFKLNAHILAKYFLEEGSLKLDPLGLLSLYSIQTKRAEDASFELTKETLTKFGTEALDEFTEDDYLIGDKDAVEIAEAAERGDMDHIWQAIIEERKMFDAEFKMIQTHKQLERWIVDYEESEYAFKRSKVKKIKSNRMIETVTLADNKEAILTEEAQVASKKSEAYATKMTLHARNEAMGVYKLLQEKSNIEADGHLVSRKIMLQQLNAFFSKLGQEPPIVREMEDLAGLLRKCCLFTMYDGEKKEVQRYTDTVRYIAVNKFGLFEDEVFEPEVKIERPKFMEDS